MVTLRMVRMAVRDSNALEEVVLTFGIASSSKEAHAKQKVLAQERKSAKPNADSIARSKKIWERLRLKSHVPRAERKELVAELFDIIRGRVKDFVLKHDSVRVIQTAIKYGHKEQRRSIAKELQGEYRTLAEGRYSKFLIGKLLFHEDKEIRDLIVPELYGVVRRMIKHPEASWILDDIYRGAATPKQKAILLREWYGAEFAIFKTGEQDVSSAELKDILAQKPEKRMPILRSLFELINQLVQKKTTGFTMLHDAMLQYYLNVNPGSEEATEYLELLKGDEEGDLLKNLAFTKSGARVVALAFAYGTAKDRKNMLKVFKSTVQLLAFDTYGHQVLLAAYDVIDDTVLTSKSIFPELLGKGTALEEQNSPLLSYVTSLNARTAILYPFSGKSKSILSADDISLLDEIHLIRATTSKKDPEVRRKELVKALSPTLLSFIAANAEALMKDTFGCQFIVEILLTAEGSREEAIHAILNLLRGSAEAQQSLQTPAAGRLLKTLVLGGHFNPSSKIIDTVDPPLGFADHLYQNLPSEALREWAVRCNSFVIVGLLESSEFTHKAELADILRKYRPELEQQSHNKGAQLLLKTISA